MSKETPVLLKAIMIFGPTPAMIADCRSCHVINGSRRMNIGDMAGDIKSTAGLLVTVVDQAVRGWIMIARICYKLTNIIDTALS